MVSVFEKEDLAAFTLAVSVSWVRKGKFGSIYLIVVVSEFGKEDLAYLPYRSS